MNSSPSLSPARSTKSQRWHILYAEDVRELRNLTRLVLTSEGHLVECVVDGQFALERLKADPTRFDLLITDHHMPRMNGLELVQHARAIKFTGRIIVFSSELGEQVPAAYRALGVDGILAKPIFPSELRQVLAHL
jgi:CheY-like chemotaxis protein